MSSLQNIFIFALTQTSEISEKAKALAIDYQDAVYHLAAEIYENPKTPLNRIEKQWKKSANIIKKEYAEKLFSFFRLRDFHREGSILYFYIQLEDNTNFAYRFNPEKNRLAIIDSREYLNSIKKGNHYKRTPLAFIHKIAKEINDEIIEDLKFPTTKGNLKRTFLNSTASALQIPRILDVVAKASKGYADVHRGMAPDSFFFTEITENVRHKILADIFEAPTDEFDIIFSYNTSEANNRFIKNIEIPKNAIVATTIAEHHSTYLPPFLKNTKVKFLKLKKNSYCLDLQAYENFLRSCYEKYQKKAKIYQDQLMVYNEKLQIYKKQKRSGYKTRKPEKPFKPAKVEWLFIAGANNVPGGINDIPAITEISRKYGVKVFIDAAQLAPHEEILMKSWKIDAMTFSGHKASGEMGAIIARKGILQLENRNKCPDSPGGSTVDLVPLAENLEKIKRGSELIKDVLYSTTPAKLEPGSPATLSFIKLGASIKLLKSIGWYHVRQHEKMLTWYVFQQFRELEKKIPHLKIKVLGSVPEKWSDLDIRLGVITFDLFLHGREVSDELLNAYLSYEWGINVRNGCFCAHPFLINAKNAQAEMKKTIEQIKKGEDFIFQGSIRLSVGLANTDKDIDIFISALESFAQSKIIYHSNGEVSIGQHRYSYSPANKYYLPSILEKREQMIRDFEKDMYQSVNPDLISIDSPKDLFIKQTK